MAARIPLTGDLARRPFTLTEGRAAELSLARLRGRDLIRPTRSVRTAVPLSTTAQRAWAFRLALPGDIAFSHRTAARLWNLWLPHEESMDEDLHVMRSSCRNRVRRSGVVGYRGLETRRVEQQRGLPVTSLPDTRLDLAPVPRGPGFRGGDRALAELLLAPGLDGPCHGGSAARSPAESTRPDQRAEASDPPGDLWHREKAKQPCTSSTS